MTDCYICGHPILEGQRDDFAYDSAFRQVGRSHLNPADHLPTLRSDRGRDPDDYQYELAVAKNERERAARMLQELANELMEQKIRSTAAMGGALSGLADRIRNGDE